MTTWEFEKWVAVRWRERAQVTTPGSRDWLIASLGLAGECGEVVELLKKHYRDGKHPGDEIKKELGDVLHYLTVIAQAYGLSLESIMRENVRKLELRDKVGKQAC